MSQRVREQILGGAGQLRGYRGISRPTPRIHADSPFVGQRPGQLLGKSTRHGYTSRPAADAPVVEEGAPVTRQGAEARGDSEEAREPDLVREVIVLSAEGQRIFAEALLNPPPPSPRLRKAIQRYRDVMNRK